MKIPSGANGKCYVMPELAASKDKARPSLSEPWLEIASDGTGTLYATDSYVAVSIPVELDAGDTPGTVPQAALKVARSRKDGLPPEVMLNSQATAVGKDGTSTVARPDLGTVPDYVAQFFGNPNPAHTITIGIDADKLAAVSKALGASNGIRLTIVLDETGGTTLKPLRVESLADGHTAGATAGADGAKGLVMPIKLAKS